MYYDQPITNGLAQPYVGRPIPRVEDRRLLTGIGRYAADFDEAGQVHAHVVRSGVSHGILRDVDVSAALARPGVVRVITARCGSPVSGAAAAALRASQKVVAPR